MKDLCDPVKDNLQADSTTLKVGQWVVVNYDGIEFPREVTTCETDVQVSVMHRSGNAWRWPTNPDEIFYEHQSILQKINFPKASGNRGHTTS